MACPRYGGRISSEWFIAKSLQILVEAPDVYQRAERLIEGADWAVWQLTGVESRNELHGGLQGDVVEAGRLPSGATTSLRSTRASSRSIDEKMSRHILPLGSRAGGLCERAAAWTGLLPGTPVAVANVDAHVSPPAVGVTEPGTMVAIMGTSICHIVLGRETADVEGMCGVVEDGVVPGLYGFEAGQSAVGDIFGWFVESCVPPEDHEEARRRGLNLHEYLEEAAGRLEPGESGLLALDWWNGNRSVLVDAELGGLLVGLTLQTRAPEIYRALIEATAFGTRVIVDAFRSAGVAVDRVVACGGLPERNKLLVQIYADVTGLEHVVPASKQTPALGAALFGAVAAGVEAGGYDSIVDASRAMAHPSGEVYRPDPARHAVYDRLYAEYVRLHDLFGRGGDDVMKTLKSIQRSSAGSRL